MLLLSCHKSLSYSVLGEVFGLQNPEHGRKLRCKIPHPTGGFGAITRPVLKV